MNLTLGAGEVVSILVAITGLAWALLKVTISQFEKRLDIKFDSIDGKFSALDGLVLEVKKLELDQLRRDNLYSEKFVTKSEIESRDNKLDKTLERLYGLLTTMNDKLDNKVNKVDCEKKCHVLRESDRE